MNARDRIAKLRRLADDIRGNSHERASARAELERLEREHPDAAKPAPAANFFSGEPRAWWTPSPFDSYRNDRPGPMPYSDLVEAMRKVYARYAPPPPPSGRRGECAVCKKPLGVMWIEFISATLCPEHHHTAARAGR